MHFAKCNEENLKNHCQIHFPQYGYTLLCQCISYKLNLLIEIDLCTVHDFNFDFLNF